MVVARAMFFSITKLPKGKFLSRFIKAAKPLEFHQYLDPFWGQNLTGGLFRKMYRGQICNLVGDRLAVDDGEVW